ncbi:MAG: ribosome recycling factor [Bacteroidota bacterium]
MNEDAQFIIDATKEQMEGAISHLESGLARVRAGRANPSMLDEIRVDYYGTLSPLSQISNINTPDARTIMIQPWEKNMLEPIQKAIQSANMGFNPINNGMLIIINIPPLTEERRKDLVKKIRIEGEHAKVSIRNARKEGNEEIKNLSKKKLAEDEIKIAEEKIQQHTDAYTTIVDKHIDAKEKEILTI